MDFLKLLWDPEEAERVPAGIFIAGLIWGLASAIISGYLFSQFSDLMVVTIAAIATIPLMYSLFRIEKEKEQIHGGESVVLEERWLLRQHSRAAEAFLWLFLGLTVSFLLAFVFGPKNLFQTQANVVLELQGIPGSLPGPETFAPIFLSNFRLLAVAILLSFLFGAGAMLVLSWNASVLAVAIGLFIQAKPWAFGIPMAVLRYFIHGIPEIIAYFAGALSGGILFHAVVRKEFNKWVLIDAGTLTLLAVALLLLGAGLEVWITPLIFK